VIGALAGLAVGSAAHWIAPTWPDIRKCSLFLAWVRCSPHGRAPLTGIVLMIELTGKYDYMLPLLVSCFVALWHRRGHEQRSDLRGVAGTHETAREAAASG